MFLKQIVVPLFCRHFHIPLTLILCMHGAKSICSFPPLVSVLRALSSISWHWASICHRSCWAGLFHLFLGLCCFLDSLAGLKRGPGWWHYHVVFFRFPLVISNLNCDPWSLHVFSGDIHHWWHFGHFTPRMYIAYTVCIILQKLEHYRCIMFFVTLQASA